MKTTPTNTPMKVILEANTLGILKAIGYSNEFIVDTERRVVRFNVKTGKPVLDELPNVEVVSNEVTGPIHGQYVFESKEDNVLLVAVVTDKNTYYTAIKKGRAVNFYAPGDQNSAESVVLALLRNNYLKGPIFYRKSSNIIPNFFMKFIGAVYKKPYAIPMTMRALNNVDVETTIHFVPGQPQSCVLEVFNMVYNYSPNHFPRDQVNDAIERHRLIEKLEATI